MTYEIHLSKAADRQSNLTTNFWGKKSMQKQNVFLVEEETYSGLDYGFMSQTLNLRSVQVSHLRLLLLTRILLSYAVKMRLQQLDEVKPHHSPYPYDCAVEMSVTSANITFLPQCTGVHYRNTAVIYLIPRLLNEPL